MNYLKLNIFSFAVPIDYVVKILKLILQSHDIKANVNIDSISSVSFQVSEETTWHKQHQTNGWKTCVSFDKACYKKYMVYG